MFLILNSAELGYSVIAADSTPADLSGMWTMAPACGRMERRQTNQIAETETSPVVLGTGHRGSGLLAKSC